MRIPPLGRSLAVAFALVTAGSSCVSYKLLTNADMAGHYTLSSVGGRALPVTTQASPRIDIVSGELTMTLDGAFAQQLIINHVASDGSTVREVDGVAGYYYTADGTVTLTETAGGGVSVGDVKGSTISFADPAGTLVYTRQ